MILRQTDHCILYHTGKQTRLATKEKATPKSRCVAESDVTYLLGLNDQTFDAATVVDFGVGVFAKG